MNKAMRKERMLELLTDKILFGLSETESKELRGLENEFPELREDSSFEVASAAIGLSGLKKIEPIPHNLQVKILNDADVFFDTRESKIAENPGVTNRSPIQAGGVKTAGLESSKPSFLQWLGWGVAALACVALVANIWLTRFAPTDGGNVAGTPQTTESPKSEPTLTEKRQALVVAAADLVKTAWTSPLKDENLRGEVVWSDSRQEGYMTFSGLGPNDIDKETYQLWIFDETQDEKTPIDGGVFDINEKGEVIIPIRAKLKVENPKAFAVTVEKPGGVVVSKREKIVALAPVKI